MPLKNVVVVVIVVVIVVVVVVVVVVVAEFKYLVELKAFMESHHSMF